MLASEQHETGRRTDYLTIAQLAVSGLGMAFSMAAAGLLAILGLILLFSEAAENSSITLLFSTAWISLLVGVLAIPSIVYSIQRLRGGLPLPRLPRLPSGGLRLATLLLLIWPLILLLGNLVSSNGRLAWLLLPPLQLLAAGIPTWWLIEFVRHKLRAGSRQRDWGLFNFSVFITTPTLMVVEILAFVILLVGFAVWASSQPTVLDELQRLAQRLANSQADPDSVMRLLSPYLQNPWMIFGILTVVAVLVPFIEEFFKPLAIWLLAGRRLAPAEGFVAGALCGAAFALVESLFYLSNPAGDGWAMLAAGRAGTILLHITTTALVGWAMAAAWRDGSYLRLGLAYLLAVGLHGLWNGMAVLSGLAVVLENPPANVGLLQMFARAAPFGLALLGLSMAILLWDTNRRLRAQPKEVAMKRETLQSIIGGILTRVAKVEFCGTEHLSVEGGLLVTTNHMSRMDTLYLFLNPQRKDITALVADKYKKYPVFNWVLDTAGIVWLDRAKADFAAFRIAANILKSGVALGIAPEGTRSRNGQLQEGKPGTVLLAEKAGVPIVPVGIAGTETFFKRLLTLRRPHVRLTFGPAYTLAPIDRENRDESLKQLTDEIMCRIAILLPPKYWGYYKDHPRLVEMLENKAQYT